jgi:solute carrier family 41
MLVPYISTPIPFLCLPVLLVCGLIFAFVTSRNAFVRPLMSEGWTPLLSAMAISGATGMVLERCVGWYEGYAILAVSMTGLSGAVGSIYASRLSTVLHVASPPPGQPAIALDELDDGRASPRTIGAALFAVSIPIQLIFVGGVLSTGWMRPEWQLITSFLLVSPITVRPLPLGRQPSAQMSTPSVADLRLPLPTRSGPALPRLRRPVDALFLGTRTGSRVRFTSLPEPTARLHRLN